LKRRITDVTDFIDTLGRIADGASIMDPMLGRRACFGRAAGRTSLHAQCARARGVGAHGRGSVECRDRPPALGQRKYRGDTRRQHSHQVGPFGIPRRSPPRSCRDQVLPGVLTRQSLLRFRDLGPEVVMRRRPYVRRSSRSCARSRPCRGTCRRIGSHSKYSFWVMCGGAAAKTCRFDSVFRPPSQCAV
jgi:hypothetical protein